MPNRRGAFHEEPSRTELDSRDVLRGLWQIAGSSPTQPACVSDTSPCDQGLARHVVRVVESTSTGRLTAVGDHVAPTRRAALLTLTASLVGGQLEALVEELLVRANTDAELTKAASA